MIVLRNKFFVGLGDGFGGKKGDIVRTCFLKKSDSYKNFGPWEVDLSENARGEYREFEDIRDLDRIDKILEEIETHPFQGSVGQHPLWEFYDKVNECVVWSAIINKEDRLNYLIFKQQNYILVTNLVGHFVIDREYAIRPKI